MNIGDLFAGALIFGAGYGALNNTTSSMSLSTTIPPVVQPPVSQPPTPNPNQPPPLTKGKFTATAFYNSVTQMFNLNVLGATPYNTVAFVSPLFKSASNPIAELDQQADASGMVNISVAALQANGTASPTPVTSATFQVVDVATNSYLTIKSQPIALTTVQTTQTNVLAPNTPTPPQTTTQSNSILSYTLMNNMFTITGKSNSLAGTNATTGFQTDNIAISYNTNNPPANVQLLAFLGNDTNFTTPIASQNVPVMSSYGTVTANALITIPVGAATPMRYGYTIVLVDNANKVYSTNPYG